ncbi:hypothetical protein [Burkholderia humptydooensis]|nr:hypothetical protein [Burkholderia humptydooensis]
MGAPNLYLCFIRAVLAPVLALYPRRASARRRRRAALRDTPFVDEGKNSPVKNFARDSSHC